MELGLRLGRGRREVEDVEEERSSNDLQLSLLPFAQVNNVNFNIPTSTSEAEDRTATSGIPNSDEEENPNSRKKLRLSKEQSAFLEETFKEHTTLNPKQKVALAKHLNLRPRQVEVWFQNRRARTKLKQTEVDCEYLKRCCQTLTEENRQLQKEVSDLRSLKTHSHAFLMQLPATTLSMCPSCEITVTNVASSNSSSQNNKANNASFGSLFAASKPRIYPFAPRSAPAPAS